MICSDKKEINHRGGYFFVLLSAICFATGGLLIKINSWSPMTISGIRSLFAMPVFYLYFKNAGHAFKWNRTVLLGALANSGMSTTFVIANKLTSAANSIVLQFTMPIYIILLLWIFWKQKPDRVSVVAAAFSFVGVLFFFFDRISMSGMIGNVIALLSGFLYAIVFLIKKIPDSDFEASALLSFAINFVIGLPFCLRETDMSCTNLVSALLLGIVQVGMAYIFLARGLDTVPPTAAALTSMIEPVLNPILVAAFYGETIGPVSLVGAAIVLISSVVYQLRSTPAG
jgi:drug/metabolite transporter (DMT)-like permease